MPELDMLWMTAVIFVPAVFALGLLFFPRGTEEYMRWWSLLGTAVALVVSLCIFIDYSKMLDEHQARPENTSLLKRHDAAVHTYLTGGGDATKVGVRNSNDWVARYPWIERFNIDYYLGTDGISLPLVLLTTLLCFLAMIASWKIDKFVKGYLVLFLVL